jgi:hypothetical protein
LNALWLDVGNENTRITSNLFIDGIITEHFFIECTRDAENLIDNNIIWMLRKVRQKCAEGRAGFPPGGIKIRKPVSAMAMVLSWGTRRLRMVNNLIENATRQFFCQVCGIPAYR